MVDKFDPGPWLIPKNKKVIIVCSPRSGSRAFAMLLCDLGNRTYIGEHYHPNNNHNNPKTFQYPLEPIPERSVMKIMPYQKYPSDLLERDDVFIINFQRKDIKKQAQQIDSELRWNHKPAIKKIKEYNNWLNSFKCNIKIYIEDILQYFPNDKYRIRPDGLPSTTWKG